MRTLRSRQAIFTAYLLAITAAEVVTTYANPVAGAVVHCCILAALLIHTALAVDRREHGLLLVLSLVPLLRILSLAMPLSHYRQVYWYAIVAIPVFIATWMAVRMLGFNRREIGLSLGGIRAQSLIAATGITFGLCEYFILRPKPLADALTIQDALLPAVVLVTMTGVVEELLFRGVIQHASTAVMRSSGVFYVAVLFAVLQIGHRSPLDLLFVLGVGLFFGWAVAETGSIVGTTLSHGITNVMLFLVVPLSIVGGGRDEAVTLGVPAPATAAAESVLAPVETPIAAVLPSPLPTSTTAASPTPASTPTVAPQARAYTVQAGDTLWSIAQDFGTSVDDLASANAIEVSDLIYEGQILVLPPVEGSSTPTPVHGPEAEYVVMPGDTLYGIAQAHGTDVDTLTRLNGLEDDTIQAGQVLRLP